MQLSQQPDSFQRRSSFQELRLCFMRLLFRFNPVNSVFEEMKLTTLKRLYCGLHVAASADERNDEKSRKTHVHPKKHLYMRQIRWYTILISEDRADGCENRRMDYPGSAYNGIPTSVRFTFI